MAKYSNDVVYNIKTTLDASGITKLQSELTKLSQQVSNKSFVDKMGLSSSEIAKAQKGITQLQGAISRAFNPKIGTLDLTKFNQILSQEHISLNSISSD